jgi:hypothetical protein
MTRTKTLKEGQKDLRQLQDKLEDTDALAHAYAEAVLKEAVSRAHGRPTPQAPMAADAMGVQGTEITVLTGGTPEAVSAGSEWGSSIYTQFGPRNDGGYWLMPATESAPALAAGDAYLEQITEEAIR